MKHCFSIIALLAAGVAVAAEPTDTIARSHELEEVVVVGERSWIEGNKAIFIPTKQEKNLSTDPATLVQRMGIPTVIVEGGQIKNLRGETVPVFINGEPADNIDISTFWAKRTYRVEYIDHPTDPKFCGVSSAINILMTEYELGGVTKINAWQYMPGGGNYDVASKLVYKKMTYGVMAGGGYSRNHSQTTVGEENYEGIYYNNTLYDNIKREYDGHAWSRDDRLNLALNARYRTETTRFVATLSLSRVSNPGSGSEDADLWTPSLFDAFSSRSSNTSRSLSPRFSGEFVQTFSPKLSTKFNWNYSYAHNNSSSEYQTGGLSPILNGVREDVHSFALSNTTSYLFKPSFAVWLQASTSFDRFSTQYSGTADTRQQQWRGYTTVDVPIKYLIKDKLFFSFAPGVQIDYWHVSGSDTYTNVLPKASFNFYWTMHRRSSLQAYVEYFNRQPSASMSGDVTIRQDELNWLRGNTSLRNCETWFTDVSYSWMPLRMFTLTASLSYTRNDKEFITTYEPADEQMGGVIKTYANGAAVNSYALNMVMILRLFDDKLMLHAQPVFSYSHVGGPYADSMPWFRMRASASYDIGNFSISCNYSSAQKGLQNGGMQTSWMQDFFEAGVTYGNGDIYVHLGVGNIFHAKSKQWTKTDAGVYNSLLTSYDLGRRVNLSFTYTFGYGKKVERNIDIAPGGEIKSGALGHD